MFAPSDYCCHLDSDFKITIVERLFKWVWRFDFNEPGFCLIELKEPLDSQSLRRRMIELKSRLSEISQRRAGYPFVIRSMGRFDQQETTKFHIDGAPDRSLLLLGYEPSAVMSRVLLADYTHAAFDRGITPAEYLQEFNPMFGKNEDYLKGYIVELPQPRAGEARILLINNSSLPYAQNPKNPLGVMHQAIIATPNNFERRIVNSILLATEGNDAPADKQAEFTATNKISEKLF